MKGQQKSPATSFLIMAGANFLAMFVFGILWLFYRSDDGTRFTLLLIAAAISLVCAIAMLVLYAYFQKRLDDLKKGG